MKISPLALATAFALSSTVALAQAGGAAGTGGAGTGGTGSATSGTASPGTATPGTTTGTSGTTTVRFLSVLIEVCQTTRCRQRCLDQPFRARVVHR